VKLVKIVEKGIKISSGGLIVRTVTVLLIAVGSYIIGVRSATQEGGELSITEVPVTVVVTELVDVDMPVTVVVRETVIATRVVEVTRLVTEEVTPPELSIQDVSVDENYCFQAGCSVQIAPTLRIGQLEGIQVRLIVYFWLGNGQPMRDPTVSFQQLAVTRRIEPSSFSNPTYLLYILDEILECGDNHYATVELQDATTGDVLAREETERFSGFPCAVPLGVLSPGHFWGSGLSLVNRATNLGPRASYADYFYDQKT